MLMNNVFINTIPHSGTHLVTAILDRLGYRHTILKNRFYFRKPYFRRVQRAGINWRTSTELTNLLDFSEVKNIPVSVGSPRMVRASVINDLFRRVMSAEYIIGHMPYSDRGNEIVEHHIAKTITIIRDPRDMLISMYNHIRTRPTHNAYQFLFDDLTDESERFTAIVEGYNNKRGHLVGLRGMYQSMLCWSLCSHNMTLKFEDLVGKKGGGDDRLQFQSLRQITRHLELSENFSDDDIRNIGPDSFGVAGTFRKGGIGGWCNILKEKDKSLIKSAVGDILVELGYAGDDTW